MIRLIVILLVASGCCLHCAADASPRTGRSLLQEERKYSCDAVGQVPEQERCSFVRNSCPSESKINYSELYFCNVAPRGAFLKFLFATFVLVLLPLLFCLLGDTTEFYFAPIMAQVSMSIPKMRPRFAGVTFVALGNGAPDLSSNISAIKEGEVLLSAGALTGAAMFIQCIVASELIRIGGGVKCAGAMMRDVATYCLAIFSVLVAFWLGRVTHIFVAWAVTVYVLYVIWVFCGDEWHERGRPQPDIKGGWLALQSTFRMRQSGSQLVDDFEEGLLPWADVEVEPQARGQGPGSRQGEAGGEGRAPRASSQPEGPASPVGDSLQPYRSADWQQPSGLRQRVRQGSLGSRTSSSTYHTAMDAKAYRQLVWADLAGDPDLADEGSSAAHMARGGSGAYQPPVAAAEEEGQELLGAGAMQGQAGEEGGQEGQQEQQQQGTAPGALLLEAVDWPGIWRGLRHDVTMGACQEWDEGNVVQRTFRAATFPVLLPCYVLLRLTVPMVDPGSYSQQWLAASLLCCPLASVIYFHAFQMWAIMLAMVVGAAAAGLMFWATSETPDEPPELRFRGGFAWGPAVFSLLGFFIGVLWIDSIASEVVGVISFLASLANAPAGVMGLTLMAWGNSLGDMFGNLAMAKAGQTSMAFTACFACPLFNMLMALALGYSSYFTREGVSQVNVELTPEVALGCVFLMVHCGVIVAVGLLCGRRLPQQFYIFSRVWYGLYFVLACWLGLSHR